MFQNINTFGDVYIEIQLIFVWTTCFYRLSLLCKVQATCQACHWFLQVQESMATWDGARAQVNVGYLNLKKLGPTWFCMFLYLLIGAVKSSWKNQPFCNQEAQNPGPGTVCAASLRPQLMHTHTHQGIPNNKLIKGRSTIIWGHVFNSWYLDIEKIVNDDVDRST